MFKYIIFPTLCYIFLSAGFDSVTAGNNRLDDAKYRFFLNKMTTRQGQDASIGLKSEYLCIVFLVKNLVIL